MKPKNTIYSLVILMIIAVSSVIGCREDESCKHNGESLVVFKLYNNTEINILERNSNDTVYRHTNDTLKQFPISLVANISEFKVKRDSTLIDTLTIYHHQLDPEFLGLNCGFAPRFYIDSVTFSTQFIDSIVIKTPEVSIDVIKKNLAIYF